MHPNAKDELRIVSLLPSATEIVALIGCAPSLVGISHECDFPESIRHLPALTRSRLADSGSSKGIDAEVRHLVGEALSIYEVDARALQEAAPSVIITQDLCEVCAVSLNDVQAAVASLLHREDLQILTLSPTRLEEVLQDVLRVATALGVPRRGEQAVQVLRDRIQAIATRSQSASTCPRVVSVEWLDPIMLGGTWMPELIELAGGNPLGLKAGGPAPTVSAEELVELAPDLVLFKPCGFSIERTMKEEALIRDLCARLGDQTRAYVADGNAFFNRSGPRLVESLEIMAACVHPERFTDFASKHASSFVALSPQGT